MLKIKKILSFWIYIFYHLTKLVLFKIALSGNKFVKMLDYDKKSLDGYYQWEGGLFVWFQIVLFWGSLATGFIYGDFSPFENIVTLLSVITILRTIENIEPNWIK
jgi:hypothetical protein